MDYRYKYEIAKQNKKTVLESHVKIEKEKEKKTGQEKKTS